MGRVSDAKDRLLDAALKLVWRKSYGAVSVEDICQEAGVKKGSFYHFFPGKNELAAAAFRHLSDTMRPEYDRIFSSSVLPVDRIRGFLSFVANRQKAQCAEAGCVLGCPFSSTGTELIAIGENDGGLRVAVQEVFARKLRYLESAIRDAISEGTIKGADPAGMAKTLHMYVEGVLAQARVQNDIRLIDDLEESGLRFLGIQPAAV